MDPLNNTKPNLTFHFSRRPTVAFILVRRESRAHIYIYGLRITVCINSFSERDIETGIYIGKKMKTEIARERVESIERRELRRIKNVRKIFFFRVSIVYTSSSYFPSVES